MKEKSIIIVAGIGLLLVAGIISVIVLNSANNNSNSTVSEESEGHPENSVQLIFIHHSTGENWLSDDNGQLGMALQNNNYSVSDTNYGWGPDSIGDRTDIGNWWEWFRGPDSDDYLATLYQESEQNSEYSRIFPGSGEENVIIMFKSCFPNSALDGNASDTPPSISKNNLKGESSDSEYHTIANAKGIYIDILKYFETQQDKLFIVITAPPLGRNSTSAQQSNNAREFNNWLTSEWLENYEYDNVAVFDFYDVLTDHGRSNYLEFSDDPWDDHPSQEGNRNATEEFIPFLNDAYQTWQESI